jgi:hypothetical protein
MGAALGIGICLAALNVKYRDIKHVIPFFLQVWLRYTGRISDQPCSRALAVALQFESNDERGGRVPVNSSWHVHGTRSYVRSFCRHGIALDGQRTLLLFPKNGTHIRRRRIKMCLVGTRDDLSNAGGTLSN